MKRSVCLLLAVCALSLSPGSARAGAWAPAPGHGYAKVWLKWLPGFGYADGEGRRKDYGAYNEVFLNGYAELGLLPGLAATLHFPLAQFFSLEDTRDGTVERHLTVGDPAVGARYQFLSLGRFAAALETFARAPLAPDGERQVVYDTNQQPIGGLRIGTGIWDVYGGFALGYGWDRVYVSGSAGYTLRTSGYHDVANASIEVGGRYSERWQGRLRTIGYFSLDDGTAPRHNSPSGIGNGTQFIGFSIETEYRLKPHWLLGFALQGGGGLIRRQTGGPVIDAYVATTW